MISQGLDIVKGILVGGAGNSISPIITDTVKQLIKVLSQIQM
jgi:hypothetical protein